MSTIDDNSAYIDGIAQADRVDFLSEEQQGAIEFIRAFMSDPKRKHAVIGGVAGSGKSTVIPYIMQEFGGEDRVRVCAPTGKAALVLKRKGILHACTIHSFLYEYRTKVNKDGTVEFIRYEKPYTAFMGIRLVIVDEASMVPREFFDFMHKLPFKTLYIGDHFQLPPVGDDFNIMLNPGYRMETVLRQNAGNPIVKLAEMARHGLPIPLGLYGDSKKTLSFRPEELLEYDEVLVWTNKMRKTVNDLVRSMLGHPVGRPVVEDKVICRTNNVGRQVYNGQIFRLMSQPFQRTQHGWDVTMMDDVVYNDPYLMAASEGNTELTAAFGIERDEMEMKHGRMMEKGIIKGQKRKLFQLECLLDWGYAITVHSAQGSSWPRVAVIDEPRMKYAMDKEEYSRWLYTAITRAEESVTIYSIGKI